MYFKELQGKSLVDKMVIFKNFATSINKYKNPPKIEPKKKKPIKKLKETKVDANK